MTITAYMLSANSNDILSDKTVQTKQNK